MTSHPFTHGQNLAKAYNRIERALAQKPMSVHEVRELHITSGEVVQYYFKQARETGRLQMAYREDGTPEYRFVK